MSQVPSQNPPEIPPPLQDASQPAKGGKGLAIASMILGLVSLVLSVVPALVAIVLGIVSLAKKKPGKGMAITGIITGAIGLLILPAILVPALSRAVEMAHRAACVANLKGISKAIVLYQNSYDQAYPPDFEMLIKDGQTPKLFSCPSAAHSRQFDYFYLAPALNAPSETMVACDYKMNHQGEVRNVLYADFHVGMLKEPAFQQALNQPENAAFAAALKKAEGP
jgi:prepilin-type processing-associated H-X9-DG protein